MSAMQHRFARFPATLVALLGLACLGPVRASAAGDVSAGGDDERPRHLFVCAGDQARKAPDFLAVINFDERSGDYGQVVATRAFPAPDASGNEPHHIGLSHDGKTVACGGLLSVL